MPTSLNFPPNLPLPRRAGYRLKPLPMLSRADADQGAARVRRRVTSTLTEIPVAFAVTAPQAAVLEGFVEHEARHGEAWFNVSLLGPAGLANHEARVKGEFDLKFVGRDRWDVSLTLEVRSRPILSASGLTALIGPAGTPLVWPSQLPKPRRAGYGIKPKPNLLRSDGEAGLASARLRPGREADASLVFAMDAAQAAIFEAFLEHRARHGAAWFAIPMRSPLGLLAHDARFKGDIELEFLGGDRWSVTAPVEVRDRPMLTRAEVAELVDVEAAEFETLFAEIAAVAALVDDDLWS